MELDAAPPLGAGTSQGALMPLAVHLLRQLPLAWLVLGAASPRAAQAEPQGPRSVCLTRAARCLVPPSLSRLQPSLLDAHLPGAAVDLHNLGGGAQKVDEERPRAAQGTGCTQGWSVRGAKPCGGSLPVGEKGGTQPLGWHFNKA